MDYCPDAYNILIYGKNGSGKTEFAATWAEAGNVLYLDSDNGILTIKASSRIPLEYKHRIKRVLVFDKSADPHIKIPVGYSIVKSVFDSLVTTGEFGGFKPVTVVVDSATTLTEYTLRHVLTSNRKAPDAKPTQPDWGDLQNLTRGLINAGRALPSVNFIWIAHEKFDKDELSGRTWCLPLMVGQLAQQIGGYFDEVYHTDVFQVGTSHEYKMDTKATGLITAKSRLDLPSPIPTHYRSIKGSLEKLQQKGGLNATSNQSLIGSGVVKST